MESDLCVILNDRAVGLQERLRAQFFVPFFFLVGGGGVGIQEAGLRFCSGFGSHLVVLGSGGAVSVEFVSMLQNKLGFRLTDNLS